MLLAFTPSGHTIGFTDGDEGLPRSERQFWLGVMDDSGHDLYAALFDDGTVVRQA